MSYDAVLLIGFGGPTRPEEIRPFLTNVLRGRPVRPERVEDVVHHYEAVGGKSPFNELTFRQARGLRELLKRQGPDLPVYVGMRNWHPLLADTLGEMIRQEVKWALGIILAPHQGEASWGRYQAAVKEAQSQAQSKLGAPAPQIDYSEAWFKHPLFIEAAADRLRCKMAEIPPDRREGAKLLFTAHSVPTSAANPYVGQLVESCAAVAEQAECLGWELVYQSRSGSRRDPWLEPDVCDVIQRLPGQGYKDVVVVPIGFICDHVEVLFDLDVEAGRAAKERGMGFYRAGTVNDHPSFIRMLADLVRRAEQGHVSA
jgi:protoporphyrin/coproporphyrin ferrochelatase